MKTFHGFPSSFEDLSGRLVVIEAASGESRRARIREALESYPEPEVCWTSCNAEREGLWSGMSQFLSSILLDFQARGLEVSPRHRQELSVVIPELRGGEAAELDTLTDVATPTERVRNYAVDRIQRVLQGLADLVAQWREAKQLHPWVLVCEDLDQAGILAVRFFLELHRRAGRKTNLALIVAVEPGASTVWAAGRDSAPAALKIFWGLPRSAAQEPSPEQAGDLAAALEERVGESPLQIEKHVAELIWLWTRSDRPERAVRWQAAALALYNHMGCYEDAEQFIAPVLAGLDSLCLEGDGNAFWRMTRWNVVGNIYGCYNSVGRPDLAYAVVCESLPRLTEPSEVARAHYVLAMSHARFLPEKDPAKAEELLREGLQWLERASPSDRSVPFLTSFLLNGLAFVRHRQGRPEEAIELCRSAYEHLSERLGQGEHRLHRSVLFYNIAQVYAAMGECEEAIDHYEAAIEMDPNYSEYYNERGNMQLKLGRWAEAELSYREAIRLSSPYYEVWINLGQCCSLLGRLDEAIEAYGAALDLNPSHPLAWVGRAQALQRSARDEESLRDYTAYLALNGDDPLAWSNRAGVFWQLGRVEEALDDVRRAVELDPANDQLRHNLEYLSVAAERRALNLAA